MRLSADDAFARYGDRVFSAAFSVCGNREDADDAVQDAFLKYMTRNDDFTDENHLKAWLLRVGINRAKDLTGAFWHRNRVSWEDYMEELEFVQPEDKTLFDARLCGCPPNIGWCCTCITTRTGMLPRSPVRFTAAKGP